MNRFLGRWDLNKTNDSNCPPLVKHSASSFIIYPKNKLIKKRKKRKYTGRKSNCGDSASITWLNKQIPLKEACVQRSLGLIDYMKTLISLVPTHPLLQNSLRRRIGFLFLFKWEKRTCVVRIQCGLSTAASAAPPGLLRSSFPK